MFLIGNQKPAVKTVFGSFLDKDEHEKNRRHHIYLRCLLLCWCAAGRTSQTKNCDMFCCFPRWLFTTQTKTKMFLNDFSTVFQVRLKTYGIYSAFQKTIQKCSKASFFRSWSSLRQKKTWYSKPARKINAGFCKYQCFFACVLERRDKKTWGRGGGTKASTAGVGW